MRTIFEDSEARAAAEEVGKVTGNKALLPVLWLITIAFLVGTWGVYRWANSRPAPLPPPPPVTLADLKQVGVVLTAFNGYVRDEKWPDAEAMLSSYARQKLLAEGKTLKDSLIGNVNGMKLREAASTPDTDRTDPNIFKQNFIYVFSDDQAQKSETKIIPLSLVIENGKIVVNGWSEEKPSEKKADDKNADNKKA
ncbi:MAG: hypothetical protein JST85_07420 [Acidobacteria bacterium]|nr:hypothetical protein [Acidobacteriota bacterium]